MAIIRALSDEVFGQRLDKTRRIARSMGIDLREAPLLACFEAPVLQSVLGGREVLALARLPGMAVAAVSAQSLGEARAALESAPRLHAVAERGLVCGLSGGAVVHAYPICEEELTAFAVALFAGTAPEGLPFSLGGFTSAGRQEVTFLTDISGHRSTGARDLLHAVRDRNVSAQPAGEEAIVVDDAPPVLEAVRAALTLDLPRMPVLAHRMPSGRFRFSTAVSCGPVALDRLNAVAQGIALSCDRVLEHCGESLFVFVTEDVAGGAFDAERGARRLAEEIFGTPHAAIAFYGAEPFTGEGVLNFRPAVAQDEDFEPMEIAGEAVLVEVSDVLEFARILWQVRQGG
ncbi:MAG: hypothetical protein ACE10D_06855 [Planctomycetota bacterium]